MHEQRAAKELDYLVRKSTIPNEDHRRRIAIGSFNEGFDFFSQGISVIYSKASLWNIISILIHDGRITGERLERSWDYDRLTQELDKYAKEGEATGDLSRRIDRKTIDSGIKDQHSLNARYLGVGSAYIAHSYTMRNLFYDHSPLRTKVGLIPFTTARQSWDISLVNKRIESQLTRPQAAA